MKISVFGLGYVGAVSMACLARDGHELLGVDVDPVKLDLIKSGRSPIIEDGIQQLMQQVVAAGRVRVTSDAAEALATTELSFVCVGTPSNPNGSQDLSALLRLADQLGAALKSISDFRTIVVRSTVQPGTVDELIKPRIEAASGKIAGKDFALCFQPEFLREGSSIKDYDNPPYTIVGSNSDEATKCLREVFGHLPCDFVVASVRVAETMKYACNAFHALKVTFANEIGRLSQSVSVDPHEVMGLVCRDTRLNISPAYLKPGFAFGGSCLPKDLRALLYMGKQQDVTTPLLSSLLPSNRVHIDHAIAQVLARNQRHVGMLGLAFKTGTDDLRESPLVALAEHFIGKGLKLRIFDPDVSLSRLMGANKRYIETTIPHIAEVMSSSIEDMMSTSEVVVVGLGSKPLNERIVELARPGQYILDLVNMAGRDGLKAEYQGLCW